jgi:uncharacterized protein (DUF2235 family)
MMSNTGKNIVICCDGTGNQLGETYSNVVKLYTCLVKDNKRQMVYYDPGVGTMSDPNVVTPWSGMISKIGGMAFGWGLKRNVTEAYAYLMENYEPGDVVYMYGFSRGAYSVRVLAALIHTVGLLEKGCQHLIPYAWETFRNGVKPKVYPIARHFKETYSRDVEIYFMGVWDTVTSFGIFNRIKLPYTTNNASVKNIRHAVAIDERRTYYRQNLFGDVPGQDIKQVWFAGAHSDVGGSYDLKESGLSQLSLEWMIAESKPFAVHFDIAKVKTLLYEGNNKGHSLPNFNEEVHHSLSAFWWPLELVPKWRRRWPQLYIPFGRARKMYVDYKSNPLVPTIHESVLSKMGTGRYSPRNFDKSKPYNKENG